MVRYPHSAVIKYNDPPTTTGSTKFEGAEHSISIFCRVEAVSAGLKVTDSGREIDVKWKAFSELLTITIPITACNKRIEVLSQVKKILYIPPNSTYTEIWL
jgi:hypothetical protein